MPARANQHPTLLVPPITYLFPYVRLEVLFRRDVDADTPVLKHRRLHLVRRAWHRADHDVREREALLERARARVHGVVRVVAPRARRRRTLRVLLDAVDVDGEDARAVVREEGRERAADDLRPGAGEKVREVRAGEGARTG